jgi:hypothetical protein
VVTDADAVNPRLSVVIVVPFAVGPGGYSIFG